VDYQELREAIRKMTRDTRLFVVLKEELTRLGYWKNKARGKPLEGRR